MEFVKNKYIGSYGILIKNEKIVLVKKATGGYLGKLDLPGGGIKHQERPEEGLIREVLEETGLDVINYQLLDVTSTNISWQMKENLIEDLHHFGILYTITATGNLKEEPDGRDSNGASWYKISELKKEELTPFALYGLEKIGYKIN